MGVKDLWQLLSPIGRRVSIETLEGKILAIDMSIWITQFIKAMRDDEGKMIKNAHIIGTIRRILKLLYHRIRPIFVFDGETPALKRRIIQARRRIHEKHEYNRSNAVHKLILAHMKQHIKEQIEKSQNPTESKSTQFASNFVAPGKLPANEEQQDTNNVLLNRNDPINASHPEQSTAVYDNTKTTVDNEDDIEWEGGFETVKGKHLDSESESGEEPEWFVPDKYEDLNIDVLTSLPAHIRKSIVEDARRKERMKSRSNYIPVADDPLLYSQTQLANFLNTSKLNRRFEAAQKKILGDSDGIRIAADGKRKYQYLTKINISPQKSSSTTTTKKKPLMKDNDEPNSDDELTNFEWMFQKQDQKPTSYRTLAKQLQQENEESKTDYYDQYYDQWMEDVESEEEENEETKVGENGSPQRRFKRLRKGVSSKIDEDAKPNTSNDVVNLGDEISESELKSNKVPTYVETVDLTSLPATSQSSGVQLIESPNNEAVVEKGFYDNLHCSDDDDDFDNVEWESENIIETQEASVPVIDLEAERKRKLFEAYLNMMSDDENCDNNPLNNSKIPDTENVVNLIDNHASDKVIGISQNAIEIIAPPKNSIINEYQSSHFQPSIALSHPQPTLNANALNRAVTTAANMADWAGRVVRKVLAEHTKSDTALPATTTSALVAAEYSTNNELADIEILPTKSTSSGYTAPNSISIPENSCTQLQETITSEDESSQPFQSKVMNSSSTSFLTKQRNHAISSMESGGSESILASIAVDSGSDGEATEEMKKRIQQTNRDIERLTEEMKDEVIALIQSFDLPYIIAPYEAEAQCAVLQQIGLVDGIITEDSDAFLFGAKEIYKNIFQDQKYVEVYLAEDAKRELGLHREDLIALAYFLGSDYCEGVNGIGIVNAMEIIQAFPMHPMISINHYEASDESSSRESLQHISNGLENFKQWLLGYDVKKEILSSIEQQFAAASKKSVAGKQKLAGKRKKSNQNEGEDSEEDVSDTEDQVNSCVGPDEAIIEDYEKLTEKNSTGNQVLSSSKKEESLVTANYEDKLTEFDRKHKTGRSKWKVPDLFPDSKIAQAYLEPDTNRNQTPFQWSLPNKLKVRKFCRDILGWTDAQIDAQIDPVLQRYSERSTQSRIDQHFMSYHDNTRFAKIASERLRTTVQQITGKSVTVQPKKSRAQTAGRKKTLGLTAGETVADPPTNEVDVSIETKSKKRCRKT